jgi:hypothetical protein
MPWLLPHHLPRQRSDIVRDLLFLLDIARLHIISLYKRSSKEEKGTVSPRIQPLSSWEDSCFTGRFAFAVEFAFPHRSTPLLFSVIVCVTHIGSPGWSWSRAFVLVGLIGFRRHRKCGWWFLSLFSFVSIFSIGGMISFINVNCGGAMGLRLESCAWKRPDEAGLCCMIVSTGS